jgi:hypothetical protein
MPIPYRDADGLNDLGIVTDRPKGATHDRVNGATLK